MILLLTIFFFQIIDASKEIIVESPFYLRARVLDSQTATVQFEIADEANQRTCQLYKFTIRRNDEYPYSMPEQNLTFWRNSLELKHLPFGDYRICAIICSEYLKQNLVSEISQKKNRSIPITACVHIHAYRSHFLVLTLYILVFIILAFSQIVFTLRKRKIRGRIQTALIEVENTLQKWRTTQSSSISTDPHQTYTILQSLINLPASPLDHSKSSPVHLTTDEQPQLSHPVIFHIDGSNENSFATMP